MDLLIWIVFGGLTGWVASLIIGTNKQQGILGDIIVGMLGAVIGGYVARSLGGPGVTGFNNMSFFIALLGSIMLVAMVKLLSRTTS